MNPAGKLIRKHKETNIPLGVYVGETAGAMKLGDHMVNSAKKVVEEDLPQYFDSYQALRFEPSTLAGHAIGGPGSKCSNELLCATCNQGCKGLALVI